jgi:hypothetical protein
MIAMLLRIQAGRHRAIPASLIAACRLRSTPRRVGRDLLHRGSACSLCLTNCDGHDNFFELKWAYWLQELIPGALREFWHGWAR